MTTIIDKRSFIKKLASLCLLPLVPVSFLLSKKKSIIPLLQSFYHYPKPEKDYLKPEKDWPVICGEWR